MRRIQTLGLDTGSFRTIADRAMIDARGKFINRPERVFGSKMSGEHEDPLRCFLGCRSGREGGWQRGQPRGLEFRSSICWLILSGFQLDPSHLSHLSPASYGTCSLRTGGYVSQHRWRIWPAQQMSNIPSTPYPLPHYVAHATHLLTKEIRTFHPHR